MEKYVDFNFKNKEYGTVLEIELMEKLFKKKIEWLFNLIKYY